MENARGRVQGQSESPSRIQELSRSVLERFGGFFFGLEVCHCGGGKSDGEDGGDTIFTGSGTPQAVEVCAWKRWRQPWQRRTRSGPLHLWGRRGVGPYFFGAGSIMLVRSVSVHGDLSAPF